MGTKTYLIIGGAGFIGSHVSEKLLENSQKVICIDNFDNFYPKEIKQKNIEFALKNKNYIFKEIDICNFSELSSCFEENNIDVVVHLAAKAGVRPSINNPEAYYKTNVLGTLNVLETMKLHGKSKLIFASSSSVYGNSVEMPFSELQNVDRPISPYAASKKAGELLCYTYHELYNFDIFCLRFFTVYGPRQRPDLAIHKFTRQILNNETIKIYGNGDTCRDYTYVDDVVDGILKSINYLAGYEIINIGESRTVSVLEVVSEIEKNLNLKANIEFISYQAGDVSSTFSNISKARQLINYNPVWSFEDGIKEFVKWMKK